MPTITPSFGSTNSIAPAGVGVDPFHPTITPPAPTPPQTPVNKPPTSVTSISSTTANSYAADNNARLAALSSKGTTMGPDGLARYADGTLVPQSDPQGGMSSVPGSTQATGSQITNPQQNTGNPTGTDYTAYSIGGKQYAGDPNQNALIQKMIDNTDAASKAQVDAITSQYKNLIAKQGDINMRQQASMDQSLLMGGSSRYAQISSAGQSSAMMTYGLEQIAHLEDQENSAIAAAKAAQASGNNSILEKALTMAESARKDKQAELAKLNDQLAAQNQKIADAKIQATKDSAIASVMSSGVSDPNQILQKLQEAGYTTINAKDIADTMNNLNPNAKAVNDIMVAASKNGADSTILTKIGGAKSVAEALAAAGNVLQDPTSALGQYQAYVKQATAAGQTPLSYGGFLSKQKYDDAYATAKGTAAGTAAGGTANGPATIDYTMFPSSTQDALKSNGFLKYNEGTQNLASQLVNGMLAPGELSKRTTGTSSYNDVLTAADKYSMATTGKHFNIAKADSDYKFATNPNTKNTLNFLGSLVGADDGSGNFSGGNLGELIRLSDERVHAPYVTLSGVTIHGIQGFPALNNVKQWAAIQTGNPDVAQYYTTLLEVSDQVAKVLQGGGSGSGTSDAKLKQAESLFQKGFTPVQMKAVAASLQDLLANRASNMVRDNPYLSSYADQFGIKMNGNLPTTNSQIMQAEAVAEGKIGDFYHASDQNKALIDDIHKQFPDLSAQEIMQKLQIN